MACSTLETKNRPVLERIFWLVSFLISNAVVAYFILKVWNKWNTSPVLVSFAEVPTPVRNIPFPAITICPEIKVKRTSFNYSAMYDKVNKTDEELEQLQFSQLVCDNDFFVHFQGNDTVNNRAIEFIEEVAPNIDEVIWKCYWGGNVTSCSEIFTSVLTDAGLCYTFNILSAKEMFNSGTIQTVGKHLNHNETLNWSLEGGYPDNKAKKTYPRRALTSGATAGLNIFIVMEYMDMDSYCSISVEGVKALLHNPTDFPNVLDQYFRVPLNRDVVVGIKPKLMVTSDGLRSYPPERRQCFFATERHLQHFSNYTQRNCDFECYINYTLKNCGCVAYYMPRDKNTPICGPGKHQCMVTVSENFTSDDGLFKCNCMPACTEITYDVETSQATSRWLEDINEYLKAKGFNDTIPETLKIAVATFYYKDRQFVTSRRGELFGPTDFLASCGGLLGLYLGFSILSFVEIIYFFTVRLFCNYQTNKKEQLAP